MLTPTRLAVWGDPIAHSLSPSLHAAAYRVLGLSWGYDRRQVNEAGFSAAVGELGPEWRGLSLTMPLKHVAAELADDLDEPARLTGAANTLLLTEGRRRGFNTDVGGLVRDLAEQGVESAGVARIVGAGATATSALVALASLGVHRVEIRARRLEAVRPLEALGAALGVGVDARPLDETTAGRVDLTIGTLPGGTDIGEVARALAASGGLLVDVVYGTWPTALARAWELAGGAAVSGRGMLLQQALLQVRVFVAGDPTRELPDEPAVLAAMRGVLVGD